MAPSEVLGVALAGGSGVRARPLTLKATNYIRSKATVRFLGRRVIDWELLSFKAQGIVNFLVLAKGKANRYQIKGQVGYGEGLGINLRYAPRAFDPLDRGSADAVLRNLGYLGTEGPALVFPVDSLIDFDLDGLVEQFSRVRAPLTLLSMWVPAGEAAGRYGLVLTGPDRRVRGFVEKPSLEAILDAYPPPDGVRGEDTRVPVNAGFYWMDGPAAVRFDRDPALRERRCHRLDFGLDFLPWLIEQGESVYEFPANQVGDLGNLTSYLDTMVRVLSGGFPSLDRFLPDPWHAARRVFLGSGTEVPAEASAWENTLVGEQCRIGPGVMITNSSIGDECIIEAGAIIESSSLEDGTFVGEGARVERSSVGVMAEIHSRVARPTRLRGAGIGDEVVIEEGAVLDGTVVHPRLLLPPGYHDGPVELSTSEDVLRRFVRGAQGA